jgi:hypothetical protein
MVLQDIVDPSRDSSDLAGFGQSAQSLIHGGAYASSRHRNQLSGSRLQSTLTLVRTSIFCSGGAVMVSFRLFSYPSNTRGRPRLGGAPGPASPPFTA